MKKNPQYDFKEIRRIVLWNLVAFVAAGMVALSLQEFRSVREASFENLIKPIAEMIFGLVIIIGLIWRARPYMPPLLILVLLIAALVGLSGGAVHMFVNYSKLQILQIIPEALGLLAGLVILLLLIPMTFPEDYRPKKPRPHIGRKI